MEQSLFTEALVQSDRVLYTASSFAKESLYYLQEIGTLQSLKPHISKRSNLNSFLFFIVESGSGTLRYRNHIYELSQGDCIFIDCNNAYSHESSNDLWQLKWIHFNSASMHQIYEKYIDRGGLPVFHPDYLLRYIETFERLFVLSKSSDYIRDMRINEQLSILLTQFMEETYHPGDIENHDLKKNRLQAIKDYLDEHHQDKISLDELSEQFFINKFYLTRIFKDHYGISINTYLLNARITHAKQLLRFTDLSLEDIAQQCGLNTLYYFSRTFKKIEGISPSTYRKQW